MMCLIYIILGLIVFIYFKKDESSLNKNKKDKCVNCGKEIEKGAFHCKYCGEHLKKKCDKCGRMIEIDWRECPFCGNTEIKNKKERQL